ncbi:TetR family transcriptional regulator [Acetobacter pasteurianus]|uniref:HTH tetR-type domain-containing protein n=5 Tax=Acetobacteraceae TaxID=433 RepID=A0A1Y0YE02_ACEPA|nr:MULTISPECIES: TetR/AcrR family transcriptional regulator [Acetobacteraceae]ARW11822.1 hypothetical protein S101447_02785 [Acetobacter ascendens]ARW49195.1 hypothetical protein S1001342_02905 [Acetobacter pasteurianus subsp. pasteurianus]ASC07199.1 hypothetical protein S101468_02998 [Acetobacter pasteurianus subsp. pasteurianus]BAI01102.1 transcriptional regulator TetR [Acetobacter pasteurianus IFO 3283-01]BAI04150.1 transcriptional regulator TetR [Acetobacter pasteurianus IFO 3283-03]
MARPLSEEKRAAILRAATELVATIGISAATSQIAKRAGIADGTLFTYFPTKDDLLNQLYLSIKSALAEAIMADYPSRAGVFERTRHCWDRLVNWGAEHPAQHKAMRQLSVSDRISENTRDAVNLAFQDINRMIRDNLNRGAAGDESAAFVGALIIAMSDVTLDCIAAHPEKIDLYRESGFQVFWNGIRS